VVGRLQGQKHMGRVYGPDLMLAVMVLSEQAGWSHFFYGGPAHCANVKGKTPGEISEVANRGNLPASFRPLNSEEQAALAESVRVARRI